MLPVAVTLVIASAAGCGDSGESRESSGGAAGDAPAAGGIERAERRLRSELEAALVAALDGGETPVLEEGVRRAPCEGLRGPTDAVSSGWRARIPVVGDDRGETLLERAAAHWRSEGFRVRAREGEVGGGGQGDPGARAVFAERDGYTLSLVLGRGTDAAVLSGGTPCVPQRRT